MTPPRSSGPATLREAFAELERRADAHRPATARPAPRRRARTTPLLAVAAAAVVLVIAVVTATRIGAGPARHRTPLGPAAGPQSTGSAPPQHEPTPTPTPTPTASRPGPTGHRPPGAELARRFTAVLRHAAGPAATFTADSPGGAAVLVGQLTVHGVTGGFDLQYFRAGRGTTATCDDTDRVHCHVTAPAGGGSLATGSEALQTAPGGVTRQAVYVRPDGVEFLIHVSNAADPKGAGTVGSEPPLTIAQMVAVVTSDRW